MPRLGAFLALALLATALPAHAGDWLQFRGPNQNGVANDTGLPDKWSPAKEGENNLLWKQPFGGRSTPVIHNGRIYIINGAAPSSISEQERVMCFDANTGKPIWEHKFNIFHTDIVTNRVGWANLAADAETGNIYAHGIQGLFFCFDKDGKVLWSRSLTEEFGRITGYGGRVTSPIVDRDLVIIHFLNSNWGDQGRGGHRFLAMDKKTGEVRWWSQPGGQPLDTIYSVPVIAEIGGQRLLICGGGDGAIHALQVSTGKPIWSRMLSKRGINVSPVVDGNHVFITHSEENIDEGIQGLVMCLDASKVSNGEPAVVWKKTGILAGYASPVIDKGRLYVPDNSAELFCFDAKDGKILWEHRYGTVAKGSPVLCDGKLYISEQASKFHILQPGADECKTLHTVAFPAGPSGEVREINGSPAVANGKLYFTTEDMLFCIGSKGNAGERILGQGGEGKKDPGPITQVLVVPGDVVLAPGGSATFKVRGYDANGNFVKETEADWSLPLPTLPPTPPGGTPPPQPPALKGEIKDGKLTVDPATRTQAAYVLAKVGNVTGRARVRVVPGLPLAIDFERLPSGGVPGGWINAAGKFIVVEDNGNKMLKKRADNANSLLARASTYFGPTYLSDYTIEADMMGTQKGRFKPTMGVINSRYMLWIDGNKDRLWVSSWEANHRIENKVDLKLTPGKWYTFKLDVHMEGGKGVALGKVWPRGEKEPADWMVRIEDPIPNREGSAGLYGYAWGIPNDLETSAKNPGTEVFYDNVKVTANKK